MLELEQRLSWKTDFGAYKRKIISTVNIKGMVPMLKPGHNLP